MIILGFPNYAITKDGRVWSSPRRGSSIRGMWLRSASHKKGYLFVVLYKHRKKYIRQIHRLVLETYIGLCPSGMQCRHLDGNPANNKLENLCWGTPQENQQDRIQHGTSNRGSRNGQTKLKEKDVRTIFQMCQDGEATHQELTDTFGVSRKTIRNIATKQTWKHLWV